jgi:hypothetical protein
MQPSASAVPTDDRTHPEGRITLWKRRLRSPFCSTQHLTGLRVDSKCVHRHALSASNYLPGFNPGRSTISIFAPEPDPHQNQLEVRQQDRAPQIPLQKGLTRVRD